MKNNLNELGLTLIVNVSELKDIQDGYKIEAEISLAKWREEYQSYGYSVEIPKGYEDIVGVVIWRSSTKAVYSNLEIREYMNRSARHILYVAEGLKKFLAKLDKLEEEEGVTYTNFGASVAQIVKAFGCKNIVLQLGRSANQDATPQNIMNKVNAFVEAQKAKI